MLSERHLDASGADEDGQGGDRRLVEEELGRQLAADPEAVRVPMARLVGAGGKRLRPMLVMLGSRLGPRHDAGRAAALAAALELIHTASLVHDDYVDESPRRRGLPTVAATEGVARAVAVGDYYFAKATWIIAELGVPGVTSTVAAAMEAICRSQIDDFALRGRFPGDRDSYLRVIRGKTAALFSASCVSGALLSGTPAPIVESLARYGEEIGTAFQMADDLVDFSEGSGKPLGQDIRQRVVSLPLIYAVEDPEAGPQVTSLLGGELDDGRIERVVRLVQQTSALDSVRADARRTAGSAVDALRAVPPGPVRDLLVELASASADRST
ncbi:MAG: polyprenyl synthetase family protein [Candidatus Dormibacteraceae bacterium]